MKKRGRVTAKMLTSQENDLYRSILVDYELDNPAFLKITDKEDIVIRT